MPKAKMYYDENGNFDIAAYARDHPNSLSRDGLTFNEEIARSIANSTATQGYDRYKPMIDWRGKARGVLPDYRSLSWKV